jgi:hypothetical protein
MHGFNHAELAEAGMRDLALEQRARHDADNPAARGEGRVRHRAHQADPAAAIDDREA